VLSPARVRQDGWTGLILAAHNGHAEAVRLLVEGKADINAASKVHTPLREALRVERDHGGGGMGGVRVQVGGVKAGEGESRCPRREGAGQP
jgi:hypothetical protein